LDARNRLESLGRKSNREDITTRYEVVMEKKNKKLIGSYCCMLSPQVLL
jgi:hypothetical protein